MDYLFIIAFFIMLALSLIVVIVIEIWGATHNKVDETQTQTNDERYSDWLNRYIAFHNSHPEENKNDS